MSDEANEVTQADREAFRTICLGGDVGKEISKMLECGAWDNDSRMRELVRLRTAASQASAGEDEFGDGHFRKKPVVIEAYRFDNRLSNRPPFWLRIAQDKGLVTVKTKRDLATGMTIKTLEGEMTAEIGDWIIKGVKGEIYPCKPDIFAATYEPATLTTPVEASQPVGDAGETVTFEQAWARKEAEGYRYGRDALENVHFGWEIAIEALSPPTSDERLRPMEDAPKDGRFVLAVYKSLDGYAESLHARVFAIRHEGVTPSGYDLGWSLCPGHGGVPDKCFSGWMPIPAALNEGAA